MRKRLIVATILAIVAVAFATTTHVEDALGSPPQARPLIVSAELRGNNLIVGGADFDEKATVYINFSQVGFPNGGPQPPPIIWGLTIHAE